MTKKCPRCGRYKDLVEFGKSCKTKDGKTCYCILCGREYRNNHGQTQRLMVLEHYGGKCACCGEDHPEFLSLDHINGGGHKHQLEIKRRHVVEWVAAKGFPAGFRVLCHNCNQALGHYGYCPHRRKEG